ncbi:MAG TPA: hypothetical protein G4O06_00055 [Dehalococcoidia bacterium]|nr:hypothetical protein [Dehalococcoidia bacterium]
MKLIKIGGWIVCHARRFVFQWAEVVVSRDLFAAILERITRLSLSSARCSRGDIGSQVRKMGIVRYFS